MNEPQFVIFGKKRRALKKELGKLKRSVKTFWYWEDIDRVYGGGMTDEDANIYLTKTKKEITVLENKLSKRLT
jgi:hypothetical protein